MLIKLEQIQYSYPGQSKNILSGLNLTINSGEHVHLKGANGTGKSTLIKILATLAKPTNGTYFYNDTDVYSNLQNVRSRIQYLGSGGVGLYPRLSAYENLRFFSALRGTGQSPEELKSILERVGLKNDMDKRIFQFSLGMKQRLHLARLLCGPNEFIILDEPTIGLDIEGKSLLKELIQQDWKNSTILFSSHELGDDVNSSIRVYELKA